MNPNKMIQAIGDCNRSRQERMYRLLVLIGLLGLAAGVIAAFMAGENLNNVIAMIIAFVVILGIVFFTIHYHKR